MTELPHIDFAVLFGPRRQPPALRGPIAGDEVGVDDAQRQRRFIHAQLQSRLGGSGDATAAPMDAVMRRAVAHPARTVVPFGARGFGSPGP